MALGKSKKNVQISLDVKSLIIIVLGIGLLGMLLVWKPWSTTQTDRTIKVTGEAKVKAAPDEFVFYPNYQFKDANKDTALAQLTQRSNEVTTKLKALGVPNDKIKTNADGNNYNYFKDTDNTSTYTLGLTITTTSKELAQTVQDYLVTTQPLGGVSPQSTFSDATRKKLESQARDEATKDARAKADQSGKNLGVKILSVKTVEDGAGFAGVMPMNASATLAIDSRAGSSAAASLPIQSGENEINYTVTVTYFVK